MTEGQMWHVPITECCGVRALDVDGDGGAYETLCGDCHDVVCSSCAAWFDQEMDGDRPRTKAYCRACWLRYHADSQSGALVD